MLVYVGAGQFSSPEPHLLLNDKGTSPTVVNRLQLDNVSYAFPAAPGSEAFCLGPVNLTIEQGEIIFIVGENGCGKTTLIKLLLGLYAPQQGEIRLNGQGIDAHNRDDYRQLFTTIFADYYLFDDVVQGNQHIPEDANTYLQRLEIAHKVSVRDGSFTTTYLAPHLLHRAAAGPQTPGQNHHRHLPRRPPLRHGRSTGAHGIGPGHHRARNRLTVVASRKSLFFEVCFPV